MGCGMVLKGASQPRKALGDLNRRSPILQDQKMAAPSCLKPPAPALKSSRLAEYQLDNYNQQSKQVGWYSWSVDCGYYRCLLGFI